jgi:predicted phage gp36 major capsid-like protein
VTRLDELPAHVDALTMQVSQLRDEMRAEFSAVRSEIKAGDEYTSRMLRDDIRAAFAEVMTHARGLHEEQRAALALVAQGLGDEINAGDSRVMEQVRVLHEDIVARLTLIQEGGGASGPRRRKR